VEELEDREDGIANFETITCRQLLVVDAAGNPRIDASTSSDGTVTLPIKDAEQVE